MVLKGSGRAVICAVGDKTRWFIENPVEDLEDDNEKTPLAEQLGKLAGAITSWAYIAAFLIFAVLVIYMIFRIMFSGTYKFFSPQTL